MTSDCMAPFGRRRQRLVRKLGAALLVWAACDQPITNVALERTAEGTVRGVKGAWQELELRDFPVLKVRLEPPEEARGHVGDVMLRRLYLELVEPDDMSFSFADRAVVYAQIEGEARAPVAEALRIMPGSTVVEFVPLEVDLTSYVEAEEIVLTVAVDGRPPPQDVTLRAHVIVDVGVTSSVACEAVSSGRVE